MTNDLPVLSLKFTLENSRVWLKQHMREYKNVCVISWTNVNNVLSLCYCSQYNRGKVACLEIFIFRANSLKNVIFYTAMYECCTESSHATVVFVKVIYVLKFVKYDTWGRERWLMRQLRLEVCHQCIQINRIQFRVPVNFLNYFGN